MTRLSPAGGTTRPGDARPPSGHPELQGAVGWEPNLGAHLPALDGVRGIAILMVMLFHMTVLNSLTALDRLWVTTAGFGAGGVDLFFVLSGFLITGILVDAKGSSHYFRNFYARRVLRIFPLYYAVVFFSLVVLPRLVLALPPLFQAKLSRFGSVADDEAWYWLYLSNFSTAYRHAWRHGILDVAWSLSIEEQFYLLWPGVVLLLGRRALMRACLGLIAVAMATRTGLVLAGKDYITVLALTPCRFDALAIGAWIALAARGPRGPRVLAPAAPAVALLAGLLLLVLGSPASWDTRPLGQCVGFTVESTCFGGFLTLALVRSPVGPIGRLLRLGWLRTFGKYSYGLYLFHLPLRAAVRDLLYGPALPGRRQFLTIAGSQLPGQFLFFAVSIAGTLAIAWASWNLYEKQFLRLKAFFPAGRAGPYAAAARVAS